MTDCKLIPYAGIGSRETPEDICNTMSFMGRQLFEYGFLLRSGGAPGADSAFEKDVHSNKEIFLPYKNFFNNKSNYYDIPDLAFDIAKNYHPVWYKLSTTAKRLMARNVQQIMGPNLDNPSKFVLCWTPDGCEHHKHRTINTGGTGQAISIATDYLDIPVINMKNIWWKENFEEIIKSI